MIESAYDRLESTDLHSVWISVLSREAMLRRVKSIDMKLPLAGMLFAVKDNIDVAGMKTTAGCPEFAYLAGRSAGVVERLEAAGAVLVGKTNMDQFATGLVGVRSPYGACSSVFDEGYVSGGSSSGSALAVALGLVNFALGTDTAGSGRVPAAFNNLVGVKPTRGLLSTRGIVPACRSLDCVSIFTRTVSEGAAVFEVAAGFDVEDPFSRRSGISPIIGVGEFRFGVPRDDQLEFFGDAEARDLFRASVQQLETCGGIRVEIDYTAFREVAELLYQGPWVAERTAMLGEFLTVHSDNIDPVVRRIIEGGTKYTAVEAHRASYRLAELRRATEHEWAQMDVLLLPTTGTIFTHEQVAAEPVQRNTDLGFYTNFVNLLDLAAVAVPAGFRQNGLPFGVTLMGQAWSDPALLQIAARYQGEAWTGPRLPDGWIEVAMVGAHLEGQPLHGQLVECGARLVAKTRTTPNYKLFALANTTPAKPGLLRTLGQSGPGIEVEVYAFSAEHFGSFMVLIPPPFGIGSIELDGGRWVKGFICESAGLTGAVDITAYGSWRNFISPDRRNAK